MNEIVPAPTKFSRKKVFTMLIVIGVILISIFAGIIFLFLRPQSTPVSTSNTTEVKITNTVTNGEKDISSAAAVVKEHSYSNEVSNGRDKTNLYKLSSDFDNASLLFSTENNLNLKPSWNAKQAGNDVMWGTRTTTILKAINSRYIAFIENAFFVTRAYTEKVGVYDMSTQRFYYIYDNSTAKDNIYTALVKESDESFSYFYIPNGEGNSAQEPNGYVMKRIFSLPTLEHTDVKLSFDTSLLQGLSYVNRFKIRTLENDSVYFILSDVNQHRWYADKVVNNKVEAPFQISDPDLKDSPKDFALAEKLYFVDPVVNSSPYSPSEHETKIFDANQKEVISIKVPPLHTLNILGSTDKYIYIAERYHCPFGNGCYDAASTQILVLSKADNKISEVINNNLVEANEAGYKYYKPDISVVMLGMIK